MRSCSRSIRLVAGPDLLLALCDIPTEDSPVKQLQGGDGLVVWDFMACLIDASEGEITILASFPILDAVDFQGRVPCASELGGLGVVRSEGNGLTAEPVADVIGVAIDEGDTHGESKDLLEVFDEVGPDKVACLLESVVDVIIGLGVVDVDADSVHDRVLCQKFVVITWRSRVLIPY